MQSGEQMLTFRKNAVPSSATVVNPGDFPEDKNSSCICLFKIHNERDWRFSSGFNDGSSYIKYDAV